MCCMMFLFLAIEICSHCTAGVAFHSYLAAMSRTGILVSRHGPLMANTMFLPPGRSDMSIGFQGLCWLLDLDIKIYMPAL